MENRINTYGYAVYPCGKMPLHIVQVNHCMTAGFHVFGNARDAKTFIEEEKDDLSVYAPLVYDPDFHFSENLVNAYTHGERLYSERENHEIYTNGERRSMDYILHGRI